MQTVYERYTQTSVVKKFHKDKFEELQNELKDELAGKSK